MFASKSNQDDHCFYGDIYMFVLSTWWNWMLFIIYQSLCLQVCSHVLLVRSYFNPGDKQMVLSVHLISLVLLSCRCPVLLCINILAYTYTHPMESQKQMLRIEPMMLSFPGKHTTSVANSVLPKGLAPQADHCTSLTNIDCRTGAHSIYQRLTGCTSLYV